MTLRIFPTRFAIALCLAAGIAVTSLFSPPPATAGAINPEDTILGVVSNFYKDYLKPGRNADTIVFLRGQPSVDPALVQKMEKLFAADSKASGPDDPGYLGHDPILMAQDIPAGWEFSRPIINDGMAHVILYGLWKGGARYGICVSLASKQGYWRITDLERMDVHDAGKTCGGLTP